MRRLACLVAGTRWQGLAEATLARNFSTLEFLPVCSMKFNHLVEINDPLDPLTQALRREQVWRGLVLRAEAPMLFVPHLDACDITRRTETVIDRSLRYGEVTIRDSVTFTPQEMVRYEVPAQNEIAASRLLMAIEEPADGSLKVRFSYEDDVTEAPGSIEAFYNEFRLSAYQASDIDTIRVIRELAGEGRLDLSPASPA